MLAGCGPAAQTQGGDPTKTPAAVQTANMDVTGWTTSIAGVGPKETVTNGRLEFSLPWSTHNDQHPNDLWVKLTAPCQLSGDFTLTAHYTLTTWPLTNDVRVGVLAGGDIAYRWSKREGNEEYATYLSGAFTELSTKDTSGSVRLARTGTALTGYYLDATGAWVKIASTTVTADPVPYSLEAWSDVNFGRRDVRATIDNLTVVGNKVSCS